LFANQRAFGVPHAGFNNFNGLNSFAGVFAGSDATAVGSHAVGNFNGFNQFNGFNGLNGFNGFNRFNNFNGFDVNQLDANQLAQLNGGVNPFGFNNFNGANNFNGLNFDQFGNTIDPCAQFDVNACRESFVPTACTAQVDETRVIDTVGDSGCIAVTRLKRLACREGFDWSRVNLAQVACRRSDGSTVARVGTFAGTTGVNFATQQVVIGINSEEDLGRINTWLTGKAGSRILHRFPGRNLIVVETPAGVGSELALCNKALAWDPEAITSCNANVFLSGGSNFVGVQQTQFTQFVDSFGRPVDEFGRLLIQSGVGFGGRY